MLELYRKGGGRSQAGGAKPSGGAPKCPSCGSREWVSSRPSRGEARHPQERRGWAQRAAAAFCAALLGCAAITALAVLGAGVLPGWALWLLGACAVGTMLAGVVVSDGIAVEAKSCEVVCSGCGEGFLAPWRPGR